MGTQQKLIRYDMAGEAKPNTLRHKLRHREETDVNKTDSGDKTQRHD